MTAYKQVPVAEIKDAIKDGERLTIESAVGKVLTSLIKDCWNQNPRLRPGFASISERLANSAVSVGAAPSKSYLSKLQSRVHIETAVLKKIPIRSERGRLLCFSLVTLIVLIISGGVGTYFIFAAGKGDNQSDSLATVWTDATVTITTAPTPIATVSTLISDGYNLGGMCGITIDEYDTIYVMIGRSPPAPRIYRVNYGPPASVTMIANLTNDGLGSYFGFQGLCYFKNSLYVPRMGQLTRIDLSNNFVSRFAGNGTVGSTKDGQNSSAVFCGAIMCISDAVGNIYVGESCGAIRKVNQTGFVSIVQNASTRIPIGFTLDSDGKLLFTTANPPVVNIIDLKVGGPSVPLVGNTSTYQIPQHMVLSPG